MRRRTFGQAMVEFALAFPILLAFMLALIDAAFAFQGYITVNHAAREAVRFAVVYRPVQGECLKRDDYGGPILEPWPYCPSDYQENPTETEADYYDRRVELIKLAALEATTGLRISETCTTLGCIGNHIDDPGMLGVRVWGFQTFESGEEEDAPGLPGLPVRVQVEHNVPLVVFGAILPNAMVHVSSASEMINEGIQVGFGNLAPPTFAPVSGPLPPGPGEATSTPDAPAPPTSTPGPTPTPTPRPVYNIALAPKEATNLLPDQREHALTAHVTDDMGRNVAGARVTFRTDAGSFAMSGVHALTTVATSGADGRARAVIYANSPLTATIQAFLDYNLNTLVNTGEPMDDASKVWQVSGAHLIVSDHNPAPLSWLSVSLMDHPLTYNPHSLWWCPAAVTATQVTQQLAYPITVETSDPGALTGNYEDQAVEVPVDVAGRYRIESHQGNGGANACGQTGTLVAYSAPIEIAETPPDLVIDSVTVIDEEAIAPGAPITLAITVSNQAPVAVTTGPFDVDVYLDLDTPPSVQQLGQEKQWINALGPFESTVITAVVTVYTAEDHNVWVQVDTTDYVDEGDAGGEDNNVYGPLVLELLDCIPIPGRSDTFEGGLGAQWQTHNYGNANGSEAPAGDHLEITSRGGNLWGGDNSYYYIYQQYDGDYDARLRVVAPPTTNQWAKIGLHIAEELNSNGRTRFVMNMATNYRNPAGEQAAYRTSSGGTPSRTSGSNDATIAMPSWLRIVRAGNSYDFYHSAAEDPQDTDWTHQGSHTASVSYPYVGIAHASYSSNYGTGIVDEFELCEPTGFTSVTPPTDDLYPPGLLQCSELLRVRGFEGNPTTVFSYWKAGDRNGLTGAYQRTSAEMYRGSFSLRLHATNSVYPCSLNQLQPYLYQDVQFPTEVFSQSTLLVTGRYRITGSPFECSLPDSPDADDQLTLSLRQADGTTIVAGQDVLDGGWATGQWHALSTDLHTPLGDPSAYAGQELRLQWDAVNDEDIEGTFFYIDDVSAQLCTYWPEPDDEPGQGAIGGLVTTRGENNVPTTLPGTDVWAYTQGGDVLHTRAIHDGSYRFYNVDPGTYIIYAEAWIGGTLRTVTASVTVAADEQNLSINLLLQ